MPAFSHRTVHSALLASLGEAEHLGMKHAATVAAAKQLARRVDQLDKLGWVIDGKLDNVTLPTFLKYCESLGLTVEKQPGRVGRPPAKQDEPEPTSPKKADREERARRALSMVRVGQSA